MKSNLNMPKHNIKSGFINHCQICGNKDIKAVLDLGYQPLADDLKDTNTPVFKENDIENLVEFIIKKIL